MRSLRIGAWVVAIVGIMVLVIWPLYAGMVACTDDISMLQSAIGRRGIATMVADAWRAPFFRPLYELSASMVDQRTRDARAVLALQFSGMAAVLAGLVVGLRRVTPCWREAAPFGLAWWFLHSPTSVSLWQADTASQTWSAAAGVWLLIATDNALQERQKSSFRHVVILLAVLLFGLATKETFLGWCVSAAILVFVRRAPLRRTWPILALLTMIPATYLAVRLATTPLGQLAFGGNPGNRYRLGLDLGLFRNLLVAALGVLAIGPIHAIAQGSAVWMRVLLCLGAGLTCAVCALPLFQHRPRTREWQTGAWSAGLSTIATLPALTGSHVSELYLMGPNVGLALWFAISAGELVAVHSPRLRLAFGASILLLAALVALTGLASRCQHFAQTWASSRVLTAEIIEALRHAPTEPLIVMLGTDCAAGQHYSVYVTSPADALNPQSTERHLNATRRPLLAPVHIVIADRALPEVDSGRVRKLDCDRLFARP